MDRPGPSFLGRLALKIPRIRAFSALRGGLPPLDSLGVGESYKERRPKAGATKEKEPSVNKNDLIQKLSDTTGLPKNDAARQWMGYSISSPPR